MGSDSHEHRVHRLPPSPLSFPPGRGRGGAVEDVVRDRIDDVPHVSGIHDLDQRIRHIFFVSQMTPHSLAPTGGEGWGEGAI